MLIIITCENKACRKIHQWQSLILHPRFGAVAEAAAVMVAVAAATEHQRGCDRNVQCWPAGLPGQRRSAPQDLVSRLENFLWQYF